MKLRNKQTGEIIETYPNRFVVNSGELIRQYNSLAELNAEWEDYEEPKEREIWAEAVKVKELPSGLRIADRDYYTVDENGNKKTEFTWDEAMERFKDDPNWRLPTPKELNQMVLELGYTDEGVFEGKLFAKNLGEDSLEAYKKKDDYGLYWSSTPSSNCYSAYDLYFSSVCASPQDYDDKLRRFTIRCVRREKNEH